MRKCTSSESGVSLQRHANGPLPGKGIQTTPSGNLAPFTAAHTGGLILALCVQLLPSWLSTQIFFFNLLIIDLGLDILNFAPSLQFNFGSLLRRARPLRLAVSIHGSCPHAWQGELPGSQRLNKRRRGCSRGVDRGPSEPDRRCRPSQYSLPLSCPLITDILGKSHALSCGTLHFLVHKVKQ